MTQTAAEIEREIEETRAHVAATAEALKQKLTPQHMVRSVLKSPPARKARNAARSALPLLAVAAVATLLYRLQRSGAERAGGDVVLRTHNPPHRSLARTPQKPAAAIGPRTGRVRYLSTWAR